MANVHTRQLYIFLFLVFSIDISYGIITVAIPLYLTSLSISPADFGLIIGVASIGSILIKIPLGMLSDKVGKKQLILLGFIILLASDVLFPFYSDRMSVLRVFQGLALSLIWVPLTALFMETFRETGKIAYFTGAYMIGFLTGSLLGGLLPQYAGYRFTFLLSAGIMILCTLILSLISDPKAVIKKTYMVDKSDLAQMINAWLLGTSNIAALTIFLSFMPLFAYNQLHSSSGEIGVLIFLEGLAFVILAMPVGKIAGWSGNFKLLLACNAAMVIVFSLFYFSYSLLELAFASMMFGAISAVMLPLSTSMAGESMSDKGKAMGIFQTSYDIGSFIGPAIAGVTASAFSVRHVFFAIIPIVLLSFVLIFITRLQQNRTLP